MKKWCILLCSLFCVHFLQGQQAGGNQLFDFPQIQKDNLLLPTPEPAQLVRYVDFPVSYSTGIPEITIPLYTVKSRELTLPVALSYHASGIKTDDVSGSSGLGWSLIAGGVITRVIYNLPDDARPFDLRTKLSVMQDNDYTYLKDVLRHGKEAAYDRYYYNFCGVSGSFIYDIPSGKITQIPITDNKIEVIAAPSAPYSKFNFKVTTPDGTCYYFTETEGIGKKAGPPINMTNLYVNTDYNTTSSWYLTKIESFNKTDAIDFVYQNVGEWKRSFYSDVETASISARENSAPEGGNGADIRASSTTRFFDCKVNSEIRYPGGKMVFTYVNDRTDEGFKARLNRIDVYSGTELQRYVLLQNANSYFGDGRLKLNGVQIYGADGTLIDRYGFGYINATDSRVSHNSQDMFGYNNGKTDYSLCFLDGHGKRIPGRREYDFSYAQMYTLNRIDYITGGYAQFIYEPNSHPEPVIGPIQIGIRIKEIDQYESGGNLAKKRVFNYDQSLTSVDFTKINANCYLSQSGTYSILSVAHPKSYSMSNTYCSSSVLPGVTVENARIYYGRVTETVTGNNSADVIKTQYEYDRRYARNHYQPVYYPEISEEPGFNAVKYLGSGFAFPTLSWQQEYALKVIPGYFIESNWAYNNLLKRTVYKQEEGKFVPVEEEVNQYEKYDLKRLQVGLHVQSIVYTVHDESTGEYKEPFKKPGHFFYFEVDVYNGYCKLKSTTKRTIFGKDTVKEQWDYVYNTLSSSANPGTPIAETDPFDSYQPLEPGVTPPSPFDPLIPVDSLRDLDPILPPKPFPLASSLPSVVFPEVIFSPNTLLKSVTYTSGGKTYKHEYFYAADNAPGNAYSTMRKGNNITALSEDVFYMDGVQKARLKTDYDEFACGTLTAVLPVCSYVTVEGTETDRKTISAYDINGRPACISRTGEPKVCYIWSYHGLYPVAEIKNAEYSAVVTALGGTAYVNTLSSASTLTAADVAKLEKLRTALPSAQVTLYTYKPFVGVTSTTDGSGRKVTYEYDSGGRLEMVKDEDGKILESYQYHYKP